ncbi:hypothetical protein [Caminibacter pacificus]|uniref:Uncharacterized protein n=1 Tax=Caminibacter pacificus TaxID=1424653 RepID=A0AAJ4UX56_9BACT|nr:hypothetical protein [Caminibacter pacificus]QDD68187.1 hypothetical protein C6V80_10050 [Caminibacter pacificus]ROR38700.1 hypothetical protein EDC58_1915 [Caminibacter pacificus]
MTLLFKKDSVYLPELLQIVRQTPKSLKLQGTTQVIEQLLRAGYKHLLSIKQIDELAQYKDFITNLENTIYYDDIKDIMIPRPVLNEYFNKDYLVPKKLPDVAINRHFLIEELIEPLRNKGVVNYLGIKPSRDDIKFYDDIVKVKRKGKILHFGVWY